ncbi:MAG: hypothetical protein V7751_11535 [Pseudoalteromonas distincta]
MKVFLILGAIAVICCVLAIMKRQPKKDKKHPRGLVSKAAVSNNQTRFQATKVIPGNNACLAAQDLQGTFFLKNQGNTPSLPLPECTQGSNCHCKYDHRDDRRSDEDDRRTLSPLRSTLYLNTEADEKRSRKRGRRADER